MGTCSKSICSDPVCVDPQNLSPNFAAKPLAAEPFSATFSPLAAGHLQQNRTLAAKPLSVTFYSEIYHLHRKKHLQLENDEK